MENPFLHDYDLNALQSMKTKRFGFELYSTPRFKHAFQKNAFEEMTALIIRQNAQGVGTFIDVGAHHGFYSVLVGISNPSCRILSFEPVPENHVILKKNLALNAVTADAFQVAVSNRKGRSPFQVSEAADNSGFIANPAAGVLRTIETDVVTLDHYLPIIGEDPVLIKVDTDGHEMKILEGMQGILSRCRDVRLVIEFNPRCLETNGNGPQELLDKLSEMSLEIYFIDDEQHRYAKYTPGTDWQLLLGGKRTRNLFCLPIKNALNLCFVSHSASLAGAEHALVELVDRLTMRYGSLCTVVVPGPGPLLSKLDDLGIATMEVDYKWWCAVNLPASEQVDSLMHSSYRNVLAASDQLSRIAPDAILTNTMVIPWGAVLALKLNLPHVWMIREYGYGFEFYYTKQKSLEIIEESANQVVVVSEAIRKTLFKRMKPRQCIVASHSSVISREPVPTTEKYFHRPKSLKLVISGSILEFKGHEDAILAIKQLLQHGRDVELCILGDTGSPFSSSLKKLVESDKLADRIHFIDFLDDVVPVLQQADVGLSCSRYEGLSRSLMDMMLLGKPVIGTRVGGIPELVKDGFNGWLYPPGDVDQLIRRVDYFIEQPGQVQVYGDRARTSVVNLIHKNPIEEVIFQLCHDNRTKPLPFSRQLTNLVFSWHRGIVEDSNREKKHMVSSMEEKEKAMLDLKNELRENEKQLKALTFKSGNKDQTIQILKVKLTEKNNIIERFTKNLEEQDRLSQKVMALVEEREQELERLSGKLSLKELLSERVMIQLEEKEEEKRLLEQRLVEKDQEIGALQNRWDQTRSRLEGEAKTIQIKLDQTRNRLEREISTQALEQTGILYRGLNLVRKVRRRLRTRRDMVLIMGSGLFDRQWYLRKYPDVAVARIDPVVHFIRYGGIEGRDPGPAFSSAWYLGEYPDVRKSGVNPLVHYLLFGRKEGRLGAPQPVEEERSTGQEYFPVQSPPVESDQFTVFTICAKNFTAYARTLHETLSLYHPGAEFILFLCDEPDSGYDINALPFKIVLLDELYIPQREEMAQRYNITEFNTAIKPYAFSYIFKKLGREKVIYFDPDIILCGPLQEMLDGFSNGADCILTPHILEPAEKVHFGDNKFLQYGIYNLGFIGLRNTAEVIDVVEWWGRRLVKWCVIDLPNGFFVDQKWVDLFPAFLHNTSILHHPGYNVGYWNLSQRKIERIDGKWYSNQHPLRFVHFSGHDIHDSFHFSRHIPTENRDTIGDLKYIVDWYHERLLANGNEYYSRLPYSYSWNGASGVNLHTPQPMRQVGARNENLSFTQDESTTGKPARRPSGRLGRYFHILQNAAGYAGGWSVLIKEVFHTFKEGGYKGIRERASRLASQLEDKEDIAYSCFLNSKSWMPRIIIIDWMVPRPDQDAGSQSTFNLLKVYVNLGYDVTFIPGNLEKLDRYTESVRSLGVRCLHREDIGTIEGFLHREGEAINFVMLCRAPVAAHFIPLIRKYAQDAKIILNTIDVHYLREMREADLDGSIEKINKARRTKEWELDIMRKCDVTIVLSSIEYKLVKEELKESDIRLLPLLFVDSAVECPPFKGRKDFLFIGGFPHTPNIDAVIFFCEKIFPLVRKALPRVKFHIVGNSPPPQVVALEEINGVVVHGFVKDVAPLFQKCKLSVAPLRYGAGIKGKIATSLAYGVPVIATSLAMEGMDLEPGIHAMVADDPQQFADALVRVYNNESLWNTLSLRGRQQVFQTYSKFAMHQRIESFMKELNPSQRKIDLYTVNSRSDYDLLVQTISKEMLNRQSTERKLIQSERQKFQVDAFCAVCECDSTFEIDVSNLHLNKEARKSIPRWRDQLVCTRCGFPNIARAFAHIFLLQVRPSDSDVIYINGVNQKLFQWWKARFPSLVGCSLFDSSKPLGGRKGDLVNENLEALSFTDHSLDHVLIMDGLDQTPDDLAAFREIYRCLKPGGTLLFSASFSPERNEKLIRAQLLPGGTVKKVLKPEYRLDPEDPQNKLLCFHQFSWDLLPDLEETGFMDPEVISYWSRDLAYLGKDQFLFMTRKGK